MSPNTVGFLLRCVAWFRGLALGFVPMMIAGAVGAASAVQSFDIPAGSAETTLKLFSQQSGQEVVFISDRTAAIHTNAVKGSYTPGEAIRLLLADTRLVAVQDERTGAWRIKGVVDPKGDRAALFGSGDRPSQSAFPQRGSVAGRVFNSATGEYVRNAEVRMEGSSVLVVTDRDGSFRIDDVPFGTASITVSYTGFAPAKATYFVSAVPEAPKEIDLAGAVSKTNDGIILMQDFVVTSDREGNAKAIMEQKNAVNVKSVVATDSFGDIAEGNIGEFLKFMPGIVLDYLESDTRAARMGGLEANYGAVTLDGATAANSPTGAFSANTRQFEFEAMSINNIESIEVNKTLTADMPGNAPAGTVNLRSRSALDRKGQRFNYTLSLIGNQYEPTLHHTPGPDDRRHYKTRPAFSFDYSNTILKNKLGLAVNGAYTNVFKEQFHQDIVYDYTSAQARAAGNPLVTRINFRDGAKLNEKASYGVKLDYQPVAPLRLTLAHSYSFFNDEIFNRTYSFITTAAQLGSGSSPLRLVANPAAGNATRLENSPGLFGRKLDTMNLSLGFVYKRDRVVVDGQSSYSRARFRRGVAHLGVVSSSALSLTRIGFVAERANVESMAWNFTQTAGADWNELDHFGRLDPTGVVTAGDARGKTQQWVNQINYRRTMPWQNPTFFRAGVWSQLEVRDREEMASYTGTWIGPSGQGTVASPMPKSGTPFRIAMPWGGNIHTLPNQDCTAIEALRREHPEYFVRSAAQEAANLDVILPGNADAKESVLSGYVLANTRLKSWQLQAGLRAEDTKTTTQVKPRIPDALNPYPAATMPVERARHRWSLPRETRQGGYSDFLPSASIAYKFTPNWNAKFGYHRAIQRAPLNRLTGTMVVDEANRIVTVPNANLDPERAEKFSFAMDYYFEPTGTVGVHIFQTNINNSSVLVPGLTSAEFGFGDDPVYADYEFSSYMNIAGMRIVRGLEVNYSQQLSFLRHEALRGVRIFATYSRYNSDPRPGGFVPQNASAGLSYRFRRFNANIGATWRDDAYTGANTVASSAAYFAGDTEMLLSRVVCDVGLGFRFNRNVELMIAGRNAFNAPIVWGYKGTDGRIRQKQLFGGQWTVGLRGAF